MVVLSYERGAHVTSHGATEGFVRILTIFLLPYSIPPLGPYGIAYRMAYGSSTSGLFKKSQRKPVCGPQGYLAHKEMPPPPRIAI